MNNQRCVALYKHNKTGDYRVLRFAVDPVQKWVVASGDFVDIPAAQMDVDGLRTIVRCLDEFGKGPPRCVLQDMSARDKSAFNRHHQSVSLYIDNGVTLVLQAVTKVGGGGAIGRPEQRVELTWPCTQHEFNAALKRAFALSA